MSCWADVKNGRYSGCCSAEQPTPSESRLSSRRSVLRDVYTKWCWIIWITCSLLLGDTLRWLVMCFVYLVIMLMGACFSYENLEPLGVFTASVWMFNVLIVFHFDLPLLLKMFEMYCRQTRTSRTTKPRQQLVLSSLLSSFLLWLHLLCR